MVAAWDIYADQLLPLGHGHPLWGPEPSPEFGEVNIGDVGYFRDGYFCFLFNAMRSADDPVNSLRGVPCGFEVFQPPRSMLIHRPNHITQTQLHSKSLQSMSISMTASARENGLDVSAGLRYQCSEEAGALLILKRPAHKTLLECKVHIRKYIRTHIASWCQFANGEFGIGLDEKDIIFVSGTTKTAVWAETAFHDSTSSGELVIGGGCFVPSVTGEFRVSMSRSSDASVSCRAGPVERVSQWKDDEPIETYDQCIFLNYVKNKSRYPWRGLFMKAAAGPHESWSHNDDASTDSLGELFGNSLKIVDDDSEISHVDRRDPVDCLLDYILKYSDAEVATASDEDLISLFKGHGPFPYGDVERALCELAPSVVVDDEGCGTISLNMSTTCLQGTIANCESITRHVGKDFEHCGKESDGHSSCFVSGEIPGTGVRKSPSAFDLTSPSIDPSICDAETNTPLWRLLQIPDVAGLETSNLTSETLRWPTPNAMLASAVGPVSAVKCTKPACGHACTRSRTPRSKIQTDSKIRLYKTLTSRKCIAVSQKKHEVVWPAYLEAVLLEGLEKYHPAGPPRRLTLFSSRNIFISEHILKTTGQKRTAKQVGSRIQQLRDTSLGSLGRNMLTKMADRRKKLMMLHDQPVQPEPAGPGELTK